jgi:ribosomal protein S18 acetylase RimI-like enzyme
MTAHATVTAQDRAEHLRKMKLSEFDRVTALVETAFAEDQAREGRNFRDEMRGIRKMLPVFRVLFAVVPSMENHFYTLVWDVDGQFAAMVTLMRQGSNRQRWYIANVATHPDYRGRGLARTLVSAALDRIRTQGGQYALLHVRADNDPAYRLYRTLGFLHLETSTTLKGVAQPIGMPALPDGYALRPLPTTDWQTRLTVAQQLASPETRSVCPPTAEQIRQSWFVRQVQALLDRFQRVKMQGWAVVAGDQPTGLVMCRAQTSGSSPHQIGIEIAPDNLSAGPGIIAQAINYCVEQRSGAPHGSAPHPVLINLNGEPPDPIAWLRDHGFTPIETVHELGMKVL